MIYILKNKKLVFATNNLNKLSEVRKILENKFQILSLADINCTDELPETQHTLEGNALQKARYVFDKFGYDCFSDDTGLEIEVLNGEPGVCSARYAGEQKDPEANMLKVLTEMTGKKNRKAYFKAVIALIIEGAEQTFIGQIDGVILTEKRGGKGFGYDPIFQPLGYAQSFAELSSEEKNKISHRALAVKQLADFILPSKINSKH